MEMLRCQKTILVGALIQYSEESALGIVNTRNLTPCQKETNDKDN